MNTHHTGAVFLGVLLCGTPHLALGNGLRLASQDGFATARGEAFVATADNPSAVYYNPAGITQIEGSSMRQGMYGIYLAPTFTPPSTAANAGTTYKIGSHYASAPQVFFVHSPEDSAWSFGLGIYAPYGGSISWPQDTGFRAVAVESSLVYVTADPVVAVRLPFGFSIGAGAMVNYANLQLEQGVRRNQLPPPFTDYFRFKGDGWSLGYNIGLLWQPHETVSIGATLRSSATVRLNGQTDALFYPVIRSNFRSAAHADYAFPWTTVLGISYRPTPEWNLEFNADYTDWSSFGTVTINQADPNPNVQANPSLTLNWKPSWMYEFGVTRFLPDGWHVNAGYTFNQNSVPDDHYSPLAADLDRHFVSVGGGRRGKRFDFDIAYQFGYGPDRTVAGSSPSTVGQVAGQTADGNYDFISHAVLLTVGVRF